MPGGANLAAAKALPPILASGAEAWGAVGTLPLFGCRALRKPLDDEPGALVTPLFLSHEAREHHPRPRPRPCPRPAQRDLPCPRGRRRTRGRHSPPPQGRTTPLRAGSCWKLARLAASLSSWSQDELTALSSSCRRAAPLGSAPSCKAAAPPPLCRRQEASWRRALAREQGL